MKVTGIVTDHICCLIKREGLKFSWDRIKLTPSDPNGMPSSKPLRPTESIQPVVDRLMFNSSLEERPPIVFYEIADSLDWAHSAKRSLTVELKSNYISLSNKRLKLQALSDEESD